MDSYPLYLFHQGTNYKAYDTFGAQREREKGYVFRVWAPNAVRVQVVGSFFQWDETLGTMQRISEGGVWEGTVPEARAGDCYKFRITTQDGRVLYKADPYAFCSEHGGMHASVIWDRTQPFPWSDQAWRARARDIVHEPVNIYEMHLGSWRRHEDGSYLSYLELAEELPDYLVRMGYTHVEFLPVAEHPFDGSWGYQTSGYYAPTARFGSPDDFKFLINRLHEAGIGVFLDWVPAHFVKDEFGLIEFDGKPLYECQGADRMEHKGWGTRVFDHGRCEVQSFLISNADFWLSEYHVDGLRVDAVAAMIYLDYDRAPGEWIPNQYGENKNLEAIAFLKKLNAHISGAFPGAVMIAEESTAFPGVTHPVSEGGLGFHWKWNMGWMNDVLHYMQVDPFFRKEVHNQLTFAMLYAFSEHYILPLSHDEVVHGKKSLLDKMFGEYDQKFANYRAFLGYMYTHPGKKLLFMGGEFGQFAEWNEEKQLDWMLLGYEKHRKLHRFVRNLNHLYRQTPALFQVDDSWEGFRWISCDDREQNILSYLRTDRAGRQMLIVVNFAPVRRVRFRIGADSGTYRLLLNSDQCQYGGTGSRTSPVVRAHGKPWNGLEHHITICVPPMCVLLYERDPDDRPVRGKKIGGKKRASGNFKRNH